MSEQPETAAGRELVAACRPGCMSPQQSWARERVLAIERDARALGVAAEREHPICFRCHQCRVGTEDADVNDCGCDGPCNWHGWTDWLRDVVARPEEYTALLDPQP